MIRCSLTIFERDFLVFRRELLGEVITTVSMPLTFLLIFGWGLGGYVGDVEGVPYVVFVIPGLVTMSALLSAYDDAAWGMWFHRVVQGTINEYRVNPLTTREIVVGKIFSGFFKGMAKGMIVGLVLVLLAGFRPTLWSILLYIMFMIPGSAAFSCIGTICGTLLDTPETLGRLEGIVIMPLIFLGGAFFPLSSYPEAVRGLMRLVPTTAILDGSRQTLLQGSFDPLYLVISLITAVLAFVVAVAVFDRRLSD